MFIRTLIKGVMVVLLGISALGLPACATTEARPASLTGEEPEHERHDTGIESQAKDM